jgi:hypothetical protein
MYRRPRIIVDFGKLAAILEYSFNHRVLFVLSCPKEVGGKKP